MSDVGFLEWARGVFVKPKEERSSLVLVPCDVTSAGLYIDEEGDDVAVVEPGAGKFYIVTWYHTDEDWRAYPPPAGSVVFHDAYLRSSTWNYEGCDSVKVEAHAVELDR